MICNCKYELLQEVTCGQPVSGRTAGYTALWFKQLVAAHYFTGALPCIFSSFC